LTITHCRPGRGGRFWRARLRRDDDFCREGLGNRPCGRYTAPCGRAGPVLSARP